jgi:cell division protein ZapA
LESRSYRIKANPKDEEVVRKTVKTINDKIIEFKTQFAGKDMQDYISMVLYGLPPKFRLCNPVIISVQTTWKSWSMETQLDEALREPGRILILKFEGGEAHP